MNFKPQITLFAPADMASHVCIEGVMVAIEDGKVNATGEQVAILISHGFTTEAPAAATPAPKKETAAEKKARLAAEAEAEKRAEAEKAAAEAAAETAQPKAE